jgi:hypothetical protein
MKGHSMTPHHIPPVQWQQSIGIARQVCARVFRDGGSPADALKAFELSGFDNVDDWSKAVDRIAEMLCAPALRKAA